jgi:hypothetical protein
MAREVEIELTNQVPIFTKEISQVVLPAKDWIARDRQRSRRGRLHHNNLILGMNTKLSAPEFVPVDSNFAAPIVMRLHVNPRIGRRVVRLEWDPFENVPYIEC